MNGTQLRMAREKLRLSQGALATILGMTNTQVSRIENGHAALQIDHINLIEELLDHPEDVEKVLERSIKWQVSRIVTRGNRKRRTVT